MSALVVRYAKAPLIAAMLLVACDGSSSLGPNNPTPSSGEDAGDGDGGSMDAAIATPDMDADVEPKDGDVAHDAQANDAGTESDDDAEAPLDAAADAEPEELDGGHDDDAAILVDAAADAADEPDADSDDAGSGAGSEDGLDCFTLRAHAGGSSDPYKVGTTSDKFIDFGFDTGLGDDAYVVRITPLITSPAVQEILVFSNEYVEPGSIKTSTGVNPTGQLLYAWAPGGNALDFAKFARDAALALPAEMDVVMHIHYKSSSSTAVDDSGVRICTRAQEPAEIATISWLGNDFLNGARTRGTCDPTSSSAINVLGYMPRMRAQGESITAVINEADETTTDLYTTPFSYSSQRWLAHSALVDAGDTIAVRCTYKKAVVFGPDSTDELCYLFVVATPSGALVNGDQAIHRNACLGSLAEGLAAGFGQ